MVHDVIQPVALQDRRHGFHCSDVASKDHDARSPGRLPVWIALKQAQQGEREAGVGDGQPSVLHLRLRGCMESTTHSIANQYVAPRL